VRLEPIILELEREQNDLLIIAHESVLRVLYAYLMHCSAMDIPALKFPRDHIIEIIPAAYQNEAKRIHIPGIDPKTVPGSPEDIRIRVPSLPASGNLSPIPGLSSPAEPVESTRPPEKVINKAAEMVADKVDDED
jgi:6-phosphofructo-2-kinase / fructose-2,6-biphosphatase 4